MAIMGEQKTKQVVEWSFSFGDVSESIQNSLRQLGVDGELKTSHFSEPIGGATSAHVQLNLSTGKMILRALAEPDNLIEADIRHIGEVEFSATGAAEKTVRLGQKSMPSLVGPLKDFFNSISNHDEMRWEIGLAGSIPLDLNIHGGVGTSKLDLSGLQIKRVKMDGNVGETNLSLPAMPEAYDVDIHGGVGETTVNVAEHAAIRMRVHGGVGSIKLRLPENTATRIEVQGGLGGAKFAPRFTRVKSGGDFISSSGIWETSGFSLASQQIVISFKGGVGDLRVS
jgi:hypothetical protein